MSAGRGDYQVFSHLLDDYDDRDDHDDHDDHNDHDKSQCEVNIGINNAQVQMYNIGKPGALTDVITLAHLDEIVAAVGAKEWIINKMFENGDFRSASTVAENYNELIKTRRTLNRLMKKLPVKTGGKNIKIIQTTLNKVNLLLDKCRCLMNYSYQDNQKIIYYVTLVLVLVPSMFAVNTGAQLLLLYFVHMYS
jgi:hypothetical protein